MKYQKNLNGNKTQCTICPRNCKLNEGQRGFCHIRKNVEGEITLTSYGYNTGIAVDPIEKKPLYHFYPGSSVLSFGTIGCNMGCAFCQNWQTTKSKAEFSTLNYTSPQRIADLAQEYGCKSVAFTYNDPVVFFEYAIDTAKKCKEKGIKTIAVTAGYINPEPRKEFFKHMDAANIDLKAFNPDFYKKHCLAKMQPILDTIKYVKNETDCWLELTTLLIEGENDFEDEIKKECDWIIQNLGDEVPIHFSAFHPDYRFTDKPKTKFSTLLKAYSIAKKTGLKHIYTGNTCDIETATTYCYNCKKPLIKRDCYQITQTNIIKNSCKFCGTKCTGIF